MSGIAAVLQRDGAPADMAALAGVLARLGHRGADGEDVVAAGPLALGHHRFWVTPEEVGERQPLADLSGRYLIACDGRVDNRDELLPALGVAPAEAGTTSDAAALLGVFARWGVAGLARVVGSFAAAIWDAAERRLTLVRDPLGDRTVCYAATADAFVAASEEQAVLAHPAVGDALDERRLAQFLTLAPLDSDATFFAAVKEVPPGHAVIADDTGVRVVRYWTPAPAAPLRLRDDREYAEAFLALIRDAVRAQTRSITHVALMLSGGLDSSAIAAVAGAAPVLRAVSWVFDELPECDERRWIDPVVRHCGLEPLQFAGDGEWPFRELAAWRRNPSTPEDDLYRRLVERARAAARHGGARVLLSGMFGDHLYSGTHGWLWERWRADGAAAALAALRQESVSGWRSVLAAALPRQVPAALRRLRGAVARQRPWLTATARSLIDAGAPAADVSVAALRPAQHHSVLGLLAAHGVAGETFHAASAGVEVRHPFRDRRLVELMLRLPSDQLYRPGLTRPVLREAMRGLLPEEVRLRRGKGTLAALFHRGVVEREAAVLREKLGSGRAVWRRFVREDWVDRTMAGGDRSEIADVVLCTCALLGKWLDK